MLATCRKTGRILQAQLYSVIALLVPWHTTVGLFYREGLRFGSTDTLCIGPRVDGCEQICEFFKFLVCLLTSARVAECTARVD